MTAIVGKNGSGKSSLIKLICNLYEPSSGSLYFNQQEIEYEMVQDKFSVIFQDFVQYEFDVNENIIISEPNYEIDIEVLKRSLENAEVEEIIRSLPQGSETPLSKNFRKGTILSGGQWQRIALARAMYKKASLYIFDEPTSFIDPHHEQIIMNNIRSLANDKSVILITHKLYNLDLVDHLIVMDQGEVIAQGELRHVHDTCSLFRDMAKAPKDSNLDFGWTKAPFITFYLQSNNSENRMKQIYTALSVLCIFIIAQFELGAQADKFTFVSELGFIKSQIDGDKLQGFHKSGYKIGIGSNYELSRVSALQIKTSYNTHGSKRKDIFQDKVEDGVQLAVDLKTIGIEAAYKYSPNEKKFFVGAGALYHRILSLDYEIIDFDVSGVDRVINPEILGNAFINLKFFYGLNIIDNLSLTFYVENSLSNIIKSDYFNIIRLEPYWVGVNVGYELISKKQKKRRSRRRR